MGPGQLCDGVADCGGGEDEAAAVCAQHECGHGVRCGEGDTCLYTPHTQLCTGGEVALRDFHNTRRRPSPFLKLRLTLLHF